MVSWNHRAACLHVEKMENVADRRPFRTGACVQSGWGGPWHLRRHNQSPTGALVAASRRPAGIPPGPDAAASPLDIPEGWDPRTKQQPTGLIACPACGSAVLFESLRVLNKKKTPCQQTRSFAFYGPGGIRTLDLSDANRTLSQQSRFCAHLMHHEKRKINVYSSI